MVLFMVLIPATTGNPFPILEFFGVFIIEWVGLRVGRILTPQSAWVLRRFRNEFRPTGGRALVPCWNEFQPAGGCVLHVGRALTRQVPIQVLGACGALASIRSFSPQRFQGG